MKESTQRFLDNPAATHRCVNHRAFGFVFQVCRQAYSVGLIGLLGVWFFFKSPQFKQEILWKLFM